MLKRYLPILEWGREYNRSALSDDLIAAVIVTIMLIPQSLAYALLAGLPAQVGLYASILPLVAYGIFGTSRALAVGPVAVASLMTATAAGGLAARGTPEYYTAAITLALLSGIMLTVLGLLRLGMLANLLSHPVISGFITASGILIAASQLKGVLGVTASGETLVEILETLVPQLPETNLATLMIGGGTLVFLFWVRGGLRPLLLARGVRPRTADLATKIGPVLAVVATIALTVVLDLEDAGVAVVGEVPAGLPTLGLPTFSADLWGQLAVSALLISIVGFVESVSVGQTLAAKRRQRISPDQELIGLGTANIASAVSGGYPVTGGFSRSVVNFDAGARTPAAGMFTAAGIAVATLVLTPALRSLPRATLAATIIVAVLSIIDLGALRRLWTYSKSDFSAMLFTILVTLGVGVDAGIVAGVALSIAMHLYRTSTPHTAVLGLVPGTEYFRNVDRHDVLVADGVLTLRIDESLYFPNARYLEDTIYDQVAARPELKHVVLVCTAVNVIDASALESLEAINDRLRSAGVTFHLSGVKGPVLDRLRRSHFPQDLTGEIFLTQYDAYRALAPGLIHDAQARRHSHRPAPERRVTAWCR